MSKTLKEIYNFFEENLHIADGNIVGTLYKPNARDKTNMWSIIIELYDGEAKVPISENMLHEDLPETYNARYHTVTGQLEGKMRGSTPIIVSEGKNRGKINRTTVLTQAIVACRKKYNDKIKAKFSTEVMTFSLENMFETDSWRYAPPALRSIHDNWDKVAYPCYIQPKIDGDRLVAVHHPKIAGLGMFTRKRGKYESNQPFVKELDGWLINYPGIFVDGEVGIRGRSFQEMSGRARRKDNEDEIYYYIFDIFISYEPKLPYEDRLARLGQMFQEFKSVKMLPTYQVHGRTELDDRFNSMVGQGDEGAVVRLPDGLYEFSFFSEKRSKSVFKWKTFEDAEWPVVGFDKAEGNQENALMWECKHDDQAFKVGFAKGIFSIEDRRKLYEYLVANPDYFQDNFYMRELTIMYQSTTKAGIPIRGGAKSFREPEVQQKLMDILYR